MLDDMLDDLPIFFRSLLVGFLLIDDLSIFFEGNFYMFVQSRGCTGCNPIPARWRRSYISLGHPETWSGSKICRFVWIPYAPWCWYIHLHDWVILFGQMSVNIPAPWGIWGWCSLSFPLKHPFLGGFDYRRLQHPQGSPRWHWRLKPT